MSQSKSVFPELHLNEMLPAITIHINGIKSAALVDTNHSESIVSRTLCHSWKGKEVDVLTAQTD